LRVEGTAITHLLSRSRDAFRTHLRVEGKKGVRYGKQEEMHFVRICGQQNKITTVPAERIFREAGICIVSNAILCYNQNIKTNTISAAKEESHV
jgi:hypothetical protein